MSLPRMMHADVQFQIYRLEQMAMGGALAFDADEIRSACHLIRTLATELDATAAPVVVGEDVADRVECILSQLEGWAKAYPTDIFHEPTYAERAWLHETRPGLMDCIAASMGRHMAGCIAADLAELRKILTAALAGD